MKRIVAACAIWLLPALAIAADTPLLKATEAGDLGAANALLAKGARASEASDIRTRCFPLFTTPTLESFRVGA